MTDFEESTFKKDESEKESSPSLNRDSALQNTSTPKKNFGLFGLILMGITVALLFFFFSEKQKPKDGIQKEVVEFEPAFKKQVIVPESAPVLPFHSEDESSAEDKEKAKQEEALKQARLKSSILVYGGNGSGQGSNASSSTEGFQDTAQNSSPQNSNARFQEGIEASATPKVKAAALGSLDQIILQGKLIDGVLETAIQSDLPGMIRAIVSRDVFAESGAQILIPKGSRLIGQYNSELSQGQSRLFVIWSRLIRPDGIEVALSSGSTDPLGRAGMSGKVNHHFFKIFGNSLLLSIIGAGASTLGVSPTDQNNSIATYREQAAQAFQNSASQVLQGSLNIPPTIKIAQGTLIKVLIAKDLDFSEALNTHKNLVMIP